MGFWNHVNKVIADADVVLEVIDARFIEQTRHKEVEDKVLRAGKELLYVINKCDLVEREELEKQKKYLKNAVFVSSTQYHGLNMLRERIMIIGKRLGWDKVRVGVVGYPNVGKSSLVNALKGSKSASTSSSAGHTRGVQKIVKRGLIFLDTPGVIPYKEKDHAKEIIISSKDFNQVKDPEDAVFILLEHYPEKLKAHFEVDLEGDEFLETIALKKNFLKKGGVPDTMRAAKEILRWWQNATHK